MWCRIILTAVAISYVICVLLLSGLQKDDLDASTLEKLHKHNVNIYDMNNENLRHDCAISSYLESVNATQKHETSEQQNETTEIPAINTSKNNNDNVADNLKLEMRVPENFEDKAISRNRDVNQTDMFLKHLEELNENLKANNNKATLHNFENVTKIEENNGLQIEYMQNQPTLQNVINFWTKLTHNTMKVVTKVATTHTPTSHNINEEKNLSTTIVETSHNNGYVHSREMEYISRILAEYLASQPVSTTTQRGTTKKAYVDMITSTVRELLERTSMEEKSRNNSGKIKNYTRLFPHKVESKYMVDENKNMPHKVRYYNKQQSDSLQESMESRLGNNPYIKDRTQPFPFNKPYINQEIERKQDNDQPRKGKSDKKKMFRFKNQPKTKPDEVQPRKDVDDYMIDETKMFKNTYNNDQKIESMQGNEQQRQVDNEELKMTLTNRPHDKNQPVEGTEDNVPARNDNNDYNMTDETKNESYKLTYSNSNQQIEGIPDTSYAQMLKLSVNTAEPKLDENINPIRFLDDLLQVDSDFKTTGVPNSYHETITKSTALVINGDNKQHDKNIDFNRHRTNQYNAKKIKCKKMNQNQYVGINSDQLKGKDEIKEWEPVTNSRTNNMQFDVIPAGKRQFGPRPDFEINNDTILVTPPKIKPDKIKSYDINYNQYKALSSNINNLQLLRKYKMQNRFESKAEHEQTQIFGVNNDQFKAIPANIRKFEQTPNFQRGNDEFKVLLPSIKRSKQFPFFRKYDNRFHFLPTEIYKSDQTQNFYLNNDELKVIPQEKNKSEQNKKSETMKNELKVIPVQITNPDQYTNSGNNDNQPKDGLIKIMKQDRFEDDTKSERNKRIDNINEHLQVISVDPKDIKPIPSFGINMDGSQVIPANILKDIAEKVKQMVLKDMNKEVTSTAVTTTIVTTTIAPTTTTVAPTTTTVAPTTPTVAPTTTINTTTQPTNTTTEKASTFHKKITEAHNVIEKLMEMFKEIKAMKESENAKAATSIAPPKSSTVPATTHLKQSPIQTYHPAFFGQMNPYIQKTPPIVGKPVEVSPYGTSLVPVPINSGRNLPQNRGPQYMPKMNIQQRNEYRSAAITIQTNADEIAPLAIQISKPMKLINQHIIVTTVHPFEKLKGEQERDSKKRVEEKYRRPPEVSNRKEKFELHSELLTKRLQFGHTDSLKRHDYNPYRNRNNKGRERPKYNHESYSDSDRGLSHIDNLNRPGGLSPQGSLIDSVGLIPPRGVGPSGNFGYPGGSLSGSVGSGGFSSSGGFNRPLGLNHHGMSQPIVSDGYTDPERPRPRYEATKFHEKLERIESWPRHNWKGFRSSTSDDCCDDVASRNQMPLTKIKQRTRFDDTHFKNFLKSQQKVTDMLERILASKTKSMGPRSVELP